MFAAVPVIAMTATASPSCSACAPRRRRRPPSRLRRRTSKGSRTARRPWCADEAGERLDGDVADAEEDACSRGEHDAVVLGAGAGACGPRMTGAPIPNRAASKRDHRREREGGVRAAAGRHRDRQQDEPDGRSPRPHHWRRPTLKPKRRSAMTAISDDAAGEHDLDDRTAARARSQRRAGPTSQRRRAMPIANQRGLQSAWRSSAGGGCRQQAPSKRRGACTGTTRF